MYSSLIMKGNCLLAVLLLVFIPEVCFCQISKISGKVTDYATNAPIEFATVYLHGGNIGTSTDTLGKFNLEVLQWGDSLFISAVGYSPLHLLVDTLHAYDLRISLKALPNQLQEFLITADKDPGARLMQKVVAHKSENNISKTTSYRYRTYKRIELDVNNIRTAHLNRFKFTNAMVAKLNIGKNQDTATRTELPIYFVETVLEQYHNPILKSDEENIVAQKNLGIETDKVFRKLENFRFEINIYNNWIALFYKTFASPVADRGSDFYKFYIADSAIENEKKIYTVQFVPKGHENAFRGYLKIMDSTFAVIGFNMQLSKDANLNFVHNINLAQDFAPLKNTFQFVPIHSSSVIVFQSGLDLIGIPVSTNKRFVNVTLTTKKKFDRFSFGDDTLKSVSGATIREQAWDIQRKDEIYWSSLRSDILSQHEKAIYDMADTLNKNPRIKLTTKLAAFLGTGFWDFDNKLRIGPYSSFLSINPIEGFRSRIGFWSMPGINEHWNLNGYAAYGTRDHRFKGGLGLKYIGKSTNWSKLSFYLRSDYDLIIDYDDELDNDNIISSVLTKNIPSYRSYINEFRLQEEKDILYGLTSQTTISYKIFDPVFSFQYRNIDNDDVHPSGFTHTLPVTEFNETLVYSPGQEYKMLNYDRIKLYNTHPIYTVSYTYGFELMKAEFVYHKINVSISQNLKLPPKATLYYHLSAGRTFGVLPYILLNVPNGNQYYVSTKYGFNTMTPYEFISDRYISLRTRFSLGGALFDHIPFIQRLQWRERLSFNSFLGGISNENALFNNNSHTYLTGNIPFAEAGIGIENIFHSISIEYYWRLTHLDNVNAMRHGLFAGVTLSF